MLIAAFFFAGLTIMGVAFFVRDMRIYSRQTNALIAMFSKGNRVRDRQGREYVVTVFDSLGFAFLRPSLSDPRLRLVDLMTPAGTYRISLLQQWTPA